jgi:hypothetical protein
MQPAAGSAGSLSGQSLASVDQNIVERAIVRQHHGPRLSVLRMVHQRIQKPCRSSKPTFENLGCQV